VDNEYKEMAWPGDLLNLHKNTNLTM